MTKTASEFISYYNFGKIIIDNKTYNKDLILLGKKIIPNWWRIKGHDLCREDLKKVIEYEPELLIIGIGSSGMLKIPSNLPESLNFEIDLFPTKKAVEIYNKKVNGKQKIAAAFHLTC